MKLRSVVLLFAGIGIPLALLALLLPITWGYGGYDEHNGTVVYVDPAGPAAKAGITVGERFIASSGAQSILELSGDVGTTVHLRAVQNKGIKIVSFSFVPFSGQLAVQEYAEKILSALTALVAFIVAILVVLRARDVRVGSRAAAVLLIAGAGALSQCAALVCGNAYLATLLYWELPLLLQPATVCAALLLLAIYPPNPSPIRRVLGKAAWVALAFGVLFFANRFLEDWFKGKLPLAGGAFPLVYAVLLAVLAAAIVDALVTAPVAYRTPARWLGGMWMLAVVFAATPVIGAFGKVYVLSQSHYSDIFPAAEVCCLAFGVAYPIVRHRLVDLNILVTRATVFAAVSAIIVGLFVAAEWAIGRIFERSVGLSGDRGGIGPEIATLCVVLVLGISARSIHRFVENRLTNTFFRKRMHGLAAIERVAREADAATDARAIMDVAAQTISRALEPLGVAFYLRSGDLYERGSTAGSMAFAQTYGYNEAVPLRLRRWQEAFEVDDDSDERYHMLFLPMTLRGDLLGFLCCGPKPDRAAYLEDEISALSLLAHHVGIATAWLGRGAAAPLTFAPT